MRKIELLAPAKNAAIGMVAILAGADAVYIAAEKFGARRGAGNSLADIEQLIRFAHVYRVKIYAAVNTILADEELPEAVELIHRLYRSGIDGIIIQDMGLLECDLPPVPLIASTQANAASWQKVKFLEDAGFTRVTLARELSLDQVREIRAKTKVALEVFIHGSLCVSYSGQCYLSYAIGGDSSNRGACRQPCRKLYSLRDEKGQQAVRDRYLLCLKDLNQTEYLAELVNLGIEAFKIEGRMKDSSYVVNVVAHYRREFDRIIGNSSHMARSSVGTTATEFTPDPAKSFNRGFTTYFLGGRRSDIASLETPKTRGEPVGIVASVEPSSFSLDRPHTLVPGDGIAFVTRTGAYQGSTINQSTAAGVVPRAMSGIETGVAIYRTYDHEFEKLLEKTPATRTIPISLYLTDDGHDFHLQASDEEGNLAAITFPLPLDPARQPDSVRAMLEQNLRKFGGTEFAVASLTIELTRLPFVPLKTINEMRRLLAAALHSERERNYQQPQAPVPRNEAPYPEAAVDYRGNVMNRKAREFYARHGAVVTEPAAETGLSMKGRRVMTTKLCLRHQYSACPREKQTGVATPPCAAPPAWTLVDEIGKKYRLEFDCERCEMQIYF